MPLQTVPSSERDEIEPGQYRVKLISIEDGEAGQWGATMFWTYDVYDSAGQVIRQVRNLQSAKTGYGSRTLADCAALGLELKEGMTSAEIEAEIIGKVAMGNLELNKNGYISIKSLSPAAAQVVETNAAPLPSNDEELPF